MDTERIKTAEEQIIGAILNTPNLYDNIKGVLSSQDFYNEKNALLYECIERKSEESGNNWDYITLSLDIQEQELQKIGGLTEVTRIYTDTVTTEPTSLNEEVNYILNAAAQRRLTQIWKEANGKAEGKNFNSAIDDIIKKMETLREKAGITTKINNLLKPIDKNDFLKVTSRTTPPLHTQYIFGRDDKQTILKLPTGALTYIAAQTSHGKSRFLQNLALYQAQQEKGKENPGKVLYFSFEESLENTLIEFLNIFANTQLSEDNTETIKAYYAAAKADDSTNSTPDNMQEFAAKAAEFWEDFITTGLLTINAEEWESGELMQAIRQAAKKEKIKAVFIDYVQLLRKSGRYHDRKDEISSICTDLMQCSKVTGLPIVLAAQLNRTPTCPTELTPQCIADASNIEHSANVIVMLWNLHKAPVFDAEKWQWTERAMKDQGLTYNGSKLIGILTKNRNGRVGGWELFNFNGNTGAITGTAPIEETNNFTIEPNPLF